MDLGRPSGLSKNTQAEQVEITGAFLCGKTGLWTLPESLALSEMLPGLGLRGPISPVYPETGVSY